MSERQRSAPPAWIFIAAAALAWSAFRLRDALSPFLIAAAFAYIVNPAIEHFEARGLRRGPLVVAAYAAAIVIGVVVYAGARGAVADQIERLSANGPRYYELLRRGAATAQNRLSHSLPLPPRVADGILESILSAALDRIQDLPGQFFALFPILARAFLVPFIAFFLLVDGSDMFARLIQSAPSRLVEQAIHISGEIDLALGNYLRGIVVVAAAIAIASFTGLTILGLDNALAIALIAGFSSFIPYMGAVAGMAIGGAAALAQFGTLSAALKVVFLFLAIRLGDEIFLQPIVARHAVRLHPLIFLLALMIGAETFGFVGLIFAVPAACVIKALLSVAWSWFSTQIASDGIGLPGQEVPYT